MEKDTNANTKQAAVKIGIIAAITLVLLSIPLILIKNVIAEREKTKNSVANEIAESYGKEQTIYAPYLISHVIEENGSGKKSISREKDICVKSYDTHTSQLDYKAEVGTEVLHRSIYDVIVYNSKITVSGKLPVSDEAIKAKSNEFCIDVHDIKGFSTPSQLTFGGKTFDLYRGNESFVADVVFPENARAGEDVDFTISFELKGTESLYFNPSFKGNTSLSVSSPYPHPSFQGGILPSHREISSNGFEASWNVSYFNYSAQDKMGVKFVDPANPYQQSMRSVKYGLLIIVLVFVAGMLVEFLTHKEISTIQYTVIGLSLVLFYSLLLAFSELITFGAAYLIAAAMTTGALVLYFRGILKDRSAYVLGGFVVMVYALNYMLLQLERYALLAGSLVLFLLLCIVMYFTTNINNNKELTKTE